MSKSHPISIYLLKPGFTEANSLVITRKDGVFKPLGQQDVIGLPVGCRLYIADYAPKDPWWKDYLGIVCKLKQQSKGAILFMPAGDRNFAITFGVVAHYLKDSAYEPDFGLLATLNAVDPQSLRSMDVLHPESARRERIQPARSGGLDAFALKFNENVVRSLTGRTGSSLKSLFTAVSGSDSARVNTAATVEELQELCKTLLRQYESDVYRKKFSALRSIFPIKDLELIEALDEKLVHAFKDKDDTLNVTMPVIVDYSHVCHIRMFGGKLVDPTDGDAVWNVYQKKLKDVTLASLKKWHLSFVDDEGDRVGQSFSLYRCLSWECEHDGKTYYFCEGKWVGADESFVADLEKFVDRYFVSSDLPENQFQKEEDYNSNVRKNDKNFVCLDKKNIAPPRQSQIEPCDLIRLASDKSAELIHVKFGTHSSILSHLFAQGVNSAYALVSLVSARKTLIKLIKGNLTARSFGSLKKAIETKDLKVTFAIVSKKDAAKKSKALPFFSRITLRASIERLESMRIEPKVFLVKNCFVREEDNTSE